MSSGIIRQTEEPDVGLHDRASDDKRSSQDHCKTPLWVGVSREDHVKTACRVVSAVALALFVTVASAQPESLRPLRVAPDQLTWTADPRGYEQALIVGDPGKAGVYVARLRFPATLRTAQHSPPHTRT